MANLSQQKREKMLAFLEKLKQQHRDDETMIAINEIENELTGKKYGLVWEEHSENVDEMLETHIPVLVEDHERRIAPADSARFCKILQQQSSDYNFLIQGDNLHSLKILEKTHRNKIDVIYIDPPYNTGNKDFIYNDCYVDNNDGYKHSKWLSFMSKRLEIAKNLLSKDGVIFISIDDNEQAQLKLLCDGIFDNNNFVGCICRATGTTTGQDANKIGSSLDYCLVYSRTNNFELKGIPLSEKDLKRFKEKDEKGLYSTLQLRKTGNEDRREDRPNMFYSVIAPDGSEVYPFGPSNYLSRWRVSKESFNELLANNMIIWKNNHINEKIIIDGYEKSAWVPYVKYYAEGRTKQVSNLFIDLEGNKKASIDLKNVIGNNKFSYPKPIEFIKILLQIGSNKDSIILDFFAGSGTTGHAVVQLNKEDGGNRRYILCTNNENGICENVTYQRLKNIQEDLPHKLKYLKTDFIDRFSDEDIGIKQKLMPYIKSLIELEYGCEIDNIHYIFILTEEELEHYLTEDLTPKAKIFIAPYILLDQSQYALIHRKQAVLIDIPEYYFRNELVASGEL